MTLVFNKFYCNALSLTRLRRELPPGGSLPFVPSESLSIFLTSTAFVDAKAIYYDWLIAVYSVLRNGEIIKYRSVDSTVGFVYNIVTSSGT